MSAVIPDELDFTDPDPYRNLAAAVIWQAVVDLQGDDRRQATAARSWLFGPDLGWWCDVLTLPRRTLLRRVYDLPVMRRRPVQDTA
jgi:hypothetical protein